MRSLLPLRLAVIIGLFAWLWIKSTATDPLPDWRLGELVVIVPPAGMEVENAFETELAGLFAQQLQVKLKVVPLAVEQALPALASHQAHLATAARSSNDYPLRFGRPYQSLAEMLICHGATPDDLDELAGRDRVVATDLRRRAAMRVGAARARQAGVAIPS
jgi:membrane-bound lytic murein transglycosylase MltF